MRERKIRKEPGARNHGRQCSTAIRAAKIDSPRGAFTLGKNHDPVQDIYLRKVEGKENKVIGVAVKALADPGRGCTM